MSDTLHYKGYEGSAEVSAEDEVFHGRLLGVRALVNYESDTFRGLKEAFEEAVDDYLDLCAEEGLTPETPFKGVFNVRTSAELHRRAALYAEQHGKKLNAVVNEALAAEPALVNSDAGGKAWFYKLKIADRSELGGLMDEAAYKAHTA